MSRQIILSGPDSVGKSTLAEKVKNKYNMTGIIHSTGKTRNDFGYHLNILDYCDNYVMDRFHSGEYTYPRTYHRDPHMTFDEIIAINRRIIEKNALFVIMYSSDVEILKQRLIDRGEINYLDEIDDQVKYYYEWIYICNAYFDGYPNYYVCDIAQPDGYDKLDAWIDERFGKKSVNEAYRDVCRDLIEKGHPMETRNIRGNTLELCNYSFTVDDINNAIISLKTGKCDMTYLAGEMLWYWNSRNDVDFIGKFGKMWTKLTDDGVTNNSAYGYILQEKHGFNQIEKIIELLTVDPYSRRAVLNINVPNENVIETKDEMCTICLIYQIRENKLHCTCVMRSNDIRFGTRNDLGYFLTLQKYIADRLGVGYGSYTHVAASIHVYDKDYDFVKDVAYGTMETVDEVLDPDMLLKYNDELIDYIDNKWIDKDHFTELLKDKNIIKKVGL